MDRKQSGRRAVSPFDLGAAMGGFHAGRAECRIRRTPVPVILTDVTSMYPTDAVNQALWNFVVAERIEIDDSESSLRVAREFLDQASLETMLDRANWPNLTTLVRVEPSGDVLPTRAAYRDNSEGAFEIGFNPVAPDDPPRWFPIADCIASKLLTGKTPHIVRAITFHAIGKQQGLKPIQLRGTVPVDPYKDDFFRTIIEERSRIKRRADISAADRQRLDAFLKVLCNAAAYGINVELNQPELRGRRSVEARIWFGENEPIIKRLSAPERPGPFCFPPFAAFTTGAAHLMLAILERLITDAGGSYAFCDTDSMAIVASEQGGLIPCEGGAFRLADGRAAVKALYWAEVASSIIGRINALNPYDRQAVPDILKIEAENFDAQTGAQRELWCFGISAKRYCLYDLNENGEPELRKVSEHGLGGVYMDPAAKPSFNPRSTLADDPLGTEADELEAEAEAPDAATAERRWVREAWEWMLRNELGLPAAEPAWLDRPVVSRIAVSSPALLKDFRMMNKRRPQSRQIRPFNFVLLAHAAPTFGKKRPVLIAPFEGDSSRWKKMDWIIRETGELVRIRTAREFADERSLEVLSYRSVLSRYLNHEEAKSLAPDGSSVRGTTRGLLQRRPIAALYQPTVIGKEGNKLFERMYGLVRNASEYQLAYSDSREHIWRELVAPTLQDMPSRAIATKAGMSERGVRDVRNKGVVPNPAHFVALAWAAVEFAQRRLQQSGVKLEPFSEAIVQLSIRRQHIGNDALAILKQYQQMKGDIDSRTRCAVCQQPIVGRARYCSSKCRKQAERTRRSKLGPERG